MEETTLNEETVELEFTEETLKTYIPNVMVDGCTEIMNKIATKTIEEYKKENQNGIHTTNQ